jgi:hypothetical protein
VFTSASLDAAMAILRTRARIDDARTLAQVAYAQLEPESDKAQQARAIVRLCDERAQSQP